MTRAHQITASWIIRNKVTKQVVMETYRLDLLERLNTKKYEAIPVQQYLGSINNRPGVA